MIKSRFFWITMGTLFWGVVMALVSILLFPQNNMILMVVKFVLLTIGAVFLTLFYSGGIYINKPHNYFFFPLVCWGLILIWTSIERLFL